MGVVRGSMLTGDGNCQFRAVAFNLFGAQVHHGAVRQAAVAHMKKCAGAYPFIAPLLPPRQPAPQLQPHPTCTCPTAPHTDFFSIYFDGEDEFSSYLRTMSRNRTWGDELTLRAIVEANITSPPRLRTHVSPSPQPTPPARICHRALPSHPSTHVKPTHTGIPKPPTPPHSSVTELSPTQANTPDAADARSHTLTARTETVYYPLPRRPICVRLTS